METVLADADVVFGSGNTPSAVACTGRTDGESIAVDLSQEVAWP